MIQFQFPSPSSARLAYWRAIELKIPCTIHGSINSKFRVLYFEFPSLLKAVMQSLVDNPPPKLRGPDIDFLKETIEELNWIMSRNLRVPGTF